MTGYDVLTDTYKQLLEKKKISKDEAEQRIKNCTYLKNCDTTDLCYMLDTGAFNDIIHAYLKME